MDSDATEEQGSTEDEDTPDEDEEDEEEYIGGDFNEDVSWFFKTFFFQFSKSTFKFHVLYRTTSNG